MSGPKRADVQAELRSAQASARTASSLIADAEGSVLRALLAELNQAAKSGGSDSGINTELNGCRDDVSSTADAKSALAQAKSLRMRADAASATARDQCSAAERTHRDGVREYECANAEYHRATANLNKAHYLHDEMSWAKEATRLYGTAAALAKNAQLERQRAQKSVTDALTLARQAQAAERDAVNRVKASSRESAERTRAEEEARRIAEKARRLATIAVSGARAALDALPDGDCDKFAPGTSSQLASQLAQAKTALDSGDAAAAQKLADAVTTDAAALGTRVAHAREEFNRKITAAQTASSQLQATIDASDAELIAGWSDDPNALQAANAGLADVHALIISERFDEAVASASRLTGQLRAATTSAAEATAANDRRTSIGDAIMDVLEDMAFDVSFEEGSKSEPLRIAGQVPAATGEGDFVLELPLDGDVDFEVTDQKGEGACSNAVANLRERLASRGIRFTVTDWGHGNEPSSSPPVVRKRTEEKTHTRTRTH